MDKARAVERVRALITKATDPGASTEEARSCAMIACKLIVEHRLEIVADRNGKTLEDLLSEELATAFSADEVVIESSRRWPDAGPIPRGRATARAETPKSKRDPIRMIRASSAGFCSVCGDSYAKGDRIAYVINDQKVAHPDCLSGRGRRPNVG